MLVPLELPDVPELLPLWPEDELDEDPLCPDEPDEEDGELELWEDGLLGELLGEGRLGDGMLELGELGGGELLLEEQPASASIPIAATDPSTDFVLRILPLCATMAVENVMRSAPFAARQANGLAFAKV